MEQTIHQPASTHPSPSQRLDIHMQQLSESMFDGFDHWFDNKLHRRKVTRHYLLSALVISACSLILSCTLPQRKPLPYRLNANADYNQMIEFTRSTLSNQ